MLWVIGHFGANITSVVIDLSPLETCLALRLVMASHRQTNRRWYTSQSDPFPLLLPSAGLV